MEKLFYILLLILFAILVSYYTGIMQDTQKVEYVPREDNLEFY